jgi:hypothetical protein
MEEEEEDSEESEDEDEDEDEDNETRHCVWTREQFLPNPFQVRIIVSELNCIDDLEKQMPKGFSNTRNPANTVFQSTNLFL